MSSQIQWPLSLCWECELIRFEALWPWNGLRHGWAGAICRGRRWWDQGCGCNFAGASQSTHIATLSPWPVWFAVLDLVTDALLLLEPLGPHSFTAYSFWGFLCCCGSRLLAQSNGLEELAAIFREWLDPHHRRHGFGESTFSAPNNHKKGSWCLLYLFCTQGSCKIQPSRAARPRTIGLKRRNRVELDRLNWILI